MSFALPRLCAFALAFVSTASLSAEAAPVNEAAEPAAQEASKDQRTPRPSVSLAEDSERADRSKSLGVADLSPSDDVKLALSGYVQAGIGFRYRGEAVPRDRWETAFTGQAGLLFKASVVEVFRATVHTILTSRALEAVTGVEALDFEGDGAIDGIETRTKRFPASLLERATIAYRPLPEFGAEAGVMLIPFTVQLQSPSFALMFPSRAAPSETFVSGSDVGAMIDSDVAEGILTASAGVYQGESLGLTLEALSPRGVVIAGRVDLQPFGRFQFGEGDPFRGPFRLGVGGGALVRPASLYDKTGYEATSMLDVRAAASLRLAYQGLYLGIEYLYRRQSDELSSRPLVAHGAYSQASLFLRLSTQVALEPVARVGFVVLDQAFDARTVGFTEAGLSLYPAAQADRPDRFRLTLQYLGERRFTENEEAHGGIASARVLF